MQHQIILLTLDGPIPARTEDWPTRFSPWSDGTPIDLTGAVVGTITIEDDDASFNSGFYSPDEEGQRLTQDTVFGSGDAREVALAGTQLSNFLGAIIRDDRGGQFNVLYPRTLVGEDMGEELGGRHSVLVFPIRSGDGTLPVFDARADFTYVRATQLLAADDSLPFATCMAEGTMVRTPDGPRPIERLSAGDRVVTLDHGAQTVLWSGHTHMTPDALDLRPNLRPIRIATGALGDGCPVRDLVVSPQHRVLIRSRVARRMTGEAEVLVAARHLVGLPGVTVARPAQGVVYWHILLEIHDLMLTEGAWTESLLPGPMALRALGPVHARRIRELTAGRAMAPARVILPGRQARSLTARHAKNVRPLLEA